MTAGQIFRDIPRCAQSIVDGIIGASVADLHDATAADWRGLTLMHHSMRPVTPGASLLGRAVTAFCPPGDNMMMHCALFLAQPGDVLVISNGGVPLGALWGENAAIQAAKKRLAGVIVDGPVRDIDGLRQRGFPVWSTSISASTPTKAKLGAVNVALPCAGVLVHPGDVIVADGDGVLALHPDWVDEIGARAKARVQKDAAMQAMIAGGGTIFETLGIEQALHDMGVAMQDGTAPAR